MSKEDEIEMPRQLWREMEQTTAQIAANKLRFHHAKYFPECKETKAKQDWYDKHDGKHGDVTCPQPCPTWKMVHALEAFSREE